MKISKQALTLAEDLSLSEADAAIMQLKAELYQKAAQCIRKSKLSHAAIAKKVGTSRTQISQTSNLGENSLSMEVLFKIIFIENKIPIRFG